MLERSSLAENALNCLHDENYDLPFNLQNLNHETMIFSANRPAISLDGDWNFAVDLLDTGLRQKWFEMLPTKQQDRIEPWDYDPYQGETIPVPSCWQMQKEKWYFFEGSAWYTKQFTYTKSQDKPLTFLKIGAAQYECKIFLNNKYIGNHYGGSTPIFAELTENLKEGTNTLMICVNNTRTLDRVPMRNTDWFNYGGIYREVELFHLPQEYIKSFHIYLKPDSKYNTLIVKVTAHGHAKDALLSIDELGIKQTIPITHGETLFEFNALPELWSPDFPKLYQVKLTYQNDSVTDFVGFRQVEVRGTEILLNSRPVFLKGISVHEDDLLLGKVVTEKDLHRRFKHAKELGCNYMRFAHYPHHEKAVQLADHYGILLWAEIPVYWAIAFDNHATLKDAKNQLLELIIRDMNRASVIIWSIGNENADTDERLHFMSSLAKMAKDYDPTRLVSAACLINHSNNTIEDRLTEYLDVIGINEYYGWYEENFNDLIEIGKNSNPDKPVIISEMGADGYIGPNKPMSGFFSEMYMTEVYEKQIAYLKCLSYVKGISPWILYDFRVERRQNIYQQGWNLKGLIANDKKTKKQAFSVLSNFYQSL
ncbi:glycoside hydrolase family 2 protein [Thorsellia kenyensis]|uniref:Glycoside hydrolase family 2 protein n=1 Tax=Thorsellia kenyensis TaxID=1549888 RepID=A0ABV6CC84_9GAMM